MMTSRIYYGGSGDTYIQDAALAYMDIYRVQRSGVEHNVITSGTIGSRQVKYTASEGKLEFSIPFTGSPYDTNDLNAEDIIVTFNI